MSDDHPLTFYVKVDPSSTLGYRLTTEVCEIRETDGAPYGLAYPREHLSGLSVTAYLMTCSQYGPDGFVSKSWHGWDLAYRDRYSVGLRDLEAMVKTLRGVDRKLTARQKDHGYPTDLHTYLIAVACALGIKTYTVKNSERRYDQTGQRWAQLDGAALQDWLRQTERDLRETDGKVST